nr:unnamed protein product [Callosobruchus chinensis]
MSSVDFEYLLNKVSTQISKQNTQLREAIPARLRLAFLFKISPQVISQIVPEVCQALNEVLKEYIKVCVNGYCHL